MRNSENPNIIRKIFWTVRHEGGKILIRKARNYLSSKKILKPSAQTTKDILFINGCAIPHPERYRVDHQIEQLKANGLSCDKIFYTDLNHECLKLYRGFVFFRCPVTDTIQTFIKQAHYFNKTCFFDIDDLVINKKYTKQIPYVASLAQPDRELYDDGVSRMEKTLKLCDYLITSTTALARELKRNYNKEVLVNRNVASEEMLSISTNVTKAIKKDDKKVVIGYLSGSITHNPDFELIKPAIIKILSEYPNVQLEIMGYLDLPEELKPFERRIVKKEFTDWRKLPKVIAELDINLAPVEKSIFNEAKSENKWTEASLVKTITIASNFGAFAEVIQDGKTGLLADTIDDWYDKLKFAIENPEIRDKIAEAAHRVVLKKYITTYTGAAVSSFIEDHLARNFCFVLPTTNISGGVNVVVKHCNILRKHGYDVSIINEAKNSENIKNSDGEVNVISSVEYDIKNRFDTMVATLWTTLKFIEVYPMVKHRKYLVQNFETNFAPIGSLSRLKANSTYNAFSDIEYITISNWCRNWLKDTFDKNAKSAPNGINTAKFAFKERLMKGKIKILIEGNSIDHYKNVDESFRIVEQLDPSKFEIHYLSYEGKPKSWYRVDKFHHMVPADEVHKIYESCDILIKSSILESFSYPPLEMMATGGFAIVAPNDGNAEYLIDKKNCLLYEQGNVDSAVEKINQIISDKELRKQLISGAKETIKTRDWLQIEDRILKLYV